MKAEILRQFPWPLLPTIALLIFFTFFMALIAILSMKRIQPLLHAASLLPLAEGQKDEKNGEKNERQ